MALNTEQLKRLKDAIVVKPTGKLFVFGDDAIHYNDAIELEKIIIAADKPKTRMQKEINLPLLYVVPWYR